MDSWDKKFINLASHVATWSKDRSTKVGAVIVDNDHRVISLGYNGMPAGFDDNIDSRHERPQKYTYVVHGEQNAIFSAARLGISIKGCILYLSTLNNDLFVCAECTKAIIQSGIKKIVCKEPDWNNERWLESSKYSKEMLEECGIEIKFIKDE